MEATVMPATAPVQKQQGLNQVVINKVQRMIEDRQGDVMDTINRLLSEGRIAQDFIAPIGVSQRSKERPVISFKAEGRVQMAMPEGNFNLHGNAISQISEKMGIPAKYLRELFRRGCLAETVVRHHPERAFGMDRAYTGTDTGGRNGSPGRIVGLLPSAELSGYPDRFHP